MKKNKTLATNAAATSLVPKIMSLTQDEMKLRMDWIESEISQLSTRHGVSERIQALLYTKAQLLAAQKISIIMAKSRKGNMP